MPLAISTAAAGLYLPEYLGLPLPSTPPKFTGKTVLIWRGSSSVDATAIQLAIASGLEAITTASTLNHAFVRSIGATEVFDYKCPSVVEDIVARLQHSELVGVYDAIGEENSLTPLAAIVKLLARPIASVTVHPCEHPTDAFHPKYSM
jgi:NADPH:quinone reductase-like Zn-dependent oxidoreductase